MCCAMLRHPHDLEAPGNMRRHRMTTEPHRHPWWLIPVQVLPVLFLVGVKI